MKERKKIPGWTGKAIVGGVFLGIGAVFAIIAAFMHLIPGGPALQAGDLRILVAVFGSIGVILILAGGLLTAAELRDRRRARIAWETGMEIRATVTAVIPKMNLRINGRHPWVLECQWTDPDSGTLHIFHSRPLLFRPPAELTGRDIPVWIDRRDPDINFVDIESILPRVEIHG